MLIEGKVSFSDCVPEWGVRTGFSEKLPVRSKLYLSEGRLRIVSGRYRDEGRP
jgi:hypothetical protein